MTADPVPSGAHILTFYSYKGGTGRTMLLANIAWILASNGKRVLTIDWDLEAPGLHRYFRPFLLDKELGSSEGVIDFVFDFAAAAQTPASTADSGAEDWFLERADIARYAVALDWQFEEPGLLHFVPAGRQDAFYSQRVNTFDWHNFYLRLGGGAFLEATRTSMRSNYDYVLIDSRTGVSDTSGISTVQMPDDLVVCFTLNNQSIEGVAAVTASVLQQQHRNQPMRIFPIPTRVELAEKRKADLRRALARDRLGRFPAHLVPAQRDQYWSDAEMLYIPFYAYEEVLASFGDEPGGTTASVLTAAERITGYITGQLVQKSVSPTAEQRTWVRQQYEATPLSASAMQARLKDLSTSSLPEASALPEGSRMPVVRNPRFVGRVDELLAVARAFQESQSVVIVGQPGMGKTQLAAEFVYRFGHCFAGGVFWLNFADQHLLPSEILACASPSDPQLAAYFPSVDGAEQLRLILNTWRSDVPRLLVFDACEDLDLLNRWRPTSGGARILITTRQPLWTSSLDLRVVAVDVLSVPDGVRLLRRTAGDRDEVALKGIAETLGNVPLVVSLAGNYLASRSDANLAEEYSNQLRREPVLVHPSMRTDEPTGSAYESNATRSVGLAIARLRPGDPDDLAALNLLAHAAWFAPAEPISEPLLLLTLSAAASGLAVGVSTQRGFARLAELSLLQPETSQRWRVERGTSDFVRPRTLGTHARQDVEQVLIARADELNKQRNPQLLAALEPHLRAAADGAFWRSDTAAAALCSVVGFHLAAVGEFGNALRYVERAVQIKEVVLGDAALGTADSLNDLASVLQAQGDFSGATAAIQRALDIYSKQLGSEHTDTARASSNLGALAALQGNYAEAINRFTEALRVRTNLLGADDAETASARDNLGVALGNVGRLDEAEAHLSRALAVRERILGPDHPDVANTLNNLGLVLFGEGRIDEAARVCQRALDICKSRLGETHPETARALNNLATAMAAQGDVKAAQFNFEQALQIRLAVYGPNHPLTAVTYYNLARILLDVNQPEAGRAYLERALAIFEAEFGSDHAETSRVSAALHELDANKATSA
jgi:tetratricopeptide (TPR) repeat protein/cellulose biosynthesis protein BcsQ